MMDRLKEDVTRNCSLFSLQIRRYVVEVGKQMDVIAVCSRQKGREHVVMWESCLWREKRA